MIYRETHQVNYTVYSNALINSKLPSDAKNVLTWLLSKPKNWKLIKVVIAEALGISKHAVQQSITILKNLGYLCFFRHKDGSGHWDVYETPRPTYQAQTRVVKPSSNPPTKATQTELQSNESNQIKKTTTPEPLPDQIEEQIVVVLFENEQPAIISPDPIIVAEVERLPLVQKEKKIAARTLSNLSLDECKAILAVYSAALVRGGISNKIGYLIGLVRAAQRGTLTTPASNQPISLDERLKLQEQRRREEAERGRMDNATWAKWFESRTGVKPF
jgi:hypothetical protein